MKQYKKLGILLGLLVIACIATFSLSRYEEKQEAIQNSDEIILEIAPDTVTALSWELEEGSLAFHKGEEGWLYDEDEAFPVSEKKVNSILSHFEAFGVTFIIENVEDYSQYGLDDPEGTLHIATAETSYDIKLGNFSKMDEQRYVDIGDGNVYLVSEDPMDYVDSALSTMILHDETPDWETVTDIQFSGSASNTITRMEDSTDTYSSEDIYFLTQSSTNLPLDTDTVEDYLDTVSALDLTDYVTYNATEEELKSYGLDSPELSVTIHYTYTDDEENEISDSFLLHISRNPEELQAAEDAEAAGETAGSVTKYVRIGDSQIVYQLSDSAYNTLTAASYNDLRHKEVIWADFDDIYQIDITLEETQHTLISQLNEEDDRLWFFQTAEAALETAEETAETAEETSETTGETQEAEYAEEEAQDLSNFQSALKALTADSFTEEAPDGKEEIRLTVYLENENFPKVEIVLYRYDGSFCLAQVNGESVSLVSRSSVMELVEAVQAIVLNK